MRHLAAVLALLAGLLATAVPAAADEPRFHVVGDSVTDSAYDELRARGGASHSKPYRGIGAGRRMLQQLADQGADVVVVALGGVDVAFGAGPDNVRPKIRRVLRDDLVGVDCVVWVSVNANPNPELERWPARARRFNRVLTEEADAAGILVARWANVALQRHRQRRGWFVADHYHLRQAGQVGYATFISEFVDRNC